MALKNIGLPARVSYQRSSTFHQFLLAGIPDRPLDVGDMKSKVIEHILGEVWPNTQEPRYNTILYNTISATMLIFLGSQIIFKKYL